MSNDVKQMWAGIAKQALSFIIGVIVAAFILGKNSQKVNDLIAWKIEATQRYKNEVAPRIERMDRQGSISFDNFKQHYEIEQAKQYKRLDKLEEEASHLDTMQQQIDRLERKIGDPPSERKTR